MKLPLPNDKCNKHQMTTKRFTHLHSYRIYNPLSKSHIAHPIAVTEEWDDQKADFQGTKARNGILAQELPQTYQISPW